MTNILDPNTPVQNSKSLVFTIAAYCLISYPSPRITYATTDTNANIRKIPTTEAVHLSEPMKVPPPVRTFVILIVSEAYENWSDEKHKLIIDRNAVSGRRRCTMGYPTSSYR
jgi:hypothetical protein